MKRAWLALLAALGGAAGPAQGQADPDTAAREAARASGTAVACQAYLEAFRCVIAGLPPAVTAPPLDGKPPADLY